MANINQPPSRAPLWPWGGPRSVRERLVDPTQLDRKKKSGKKGDPRNPALASAALLEFIGPGHSSEELRLPMPPHPSGHDADLEAFDDRAALQSVAGRGDPDLRKVVERGLSRITATTERKDRLNSLLSLEELALNLIGQVYEDMAEVHRLRTEEQKDKGF